MKRYKFGDIFDDMAMGFSPFTLAPFSRSYTWGGEIVDTDKYDLVPKPAYYETLITQKQEQINALERQHENEEKYFKERLKTLKEEKETLLRERDNRK